MKLFVASITAMYAKSGCYGFVDNSQPKERINTLFS